MKKRDAIKHPAPYVSKERKGRKKSIYELLEEEVMASDMPLEEKNERLSGLIKARGRKVNILFAGATGAGKSSTINALFNMDVAEVGVGVDPETDSIDMYELENLVIWDTPGLGDGIDSDTEYSELIRKKLDETDENGDPLIDLVMVILDASSKDLGTSYDLINKVIIPCLDADTEGRLLIGLNQSDVAMKGKHWDDDKNEPDAVLLDHLKKKTASVARRIKEATGVEVDPVFYAAGYKEADGEQCSPYNLTKLLYYIVKSIPEDKRLSLVSNINEDEENWMYDDAEEDYKEETRRSFFSVVGENISEMSDAFDCIGEYVLGVPGKYIGKAVGGALGAVCGVLLAVCE